jgi:hypothetical protein
MIDATGGKSSIKNSVAIMSAGDVFVVNLCASMTPMPSVPKSLKGFEDYRLYQVSKVEDGRHRYRLRLGFFNSEGDAELAVASLRALYPAAFTSRAGNEDMRYAGDPLLTGRFTARSPAATPAVEAKPVAYVEPAPKKPVEVSNAQPAAPKAMPAPAVVTRAPVVEKKPAAPAPVVASVELTAQSLLDVDVKGMPTRERNTPFTMRTHQPFHVARGIDLPDTDLELAPTIIPTPVKPPASVTSGAAAKQTRPAPAVVEKKPAPMQVAKPAAKPAVPPQVSKSMAALASAVAKKDTAQPVAAKPAVAMKPAAPVAAAAAPLSNKPANTKPTDDYVPVLDTTMTIRTLSLAEMEDKNAAKWFSVQLAVSEQPFNLDAMPRLDIFAAYRLYSVAVNEDSKLKHSLRLGFFKEEVSAEAVSGYLTTFFPSPSITRIGVAEYERFNEPPEAAPAEPESKVVSLNQKREVAPPPKPTFGVNPAPTPTRAKTPAAKPVDKHETTQPGMRRGPSGKYSVDAMAKKHSNHASDSGVRKNMQKSQSFLSKLIGRELD